MEKYRKSRGSFLAPSRKSLTFSNIFVEDTQKDADKTKYTAKQYLESLKKEKEDWKCILQNKKQKLKDCQSKCKSDPLVITRADVENYFTPDDHEFFNDKPDYVGILKSLSKYADALSYLNLYKSDITDYYKKACNELDIEKHILVKKMCAEDLCEICNIKNCQKTDHQFIL